MTWNGWAQIVLYCLIVVALVRPLGGYLTRLFAGERTCFARAGPVERGLYRLAGVDARAEQDWASYALAMLAFNAAGRAAALWAAAPARRPAAEPAGPGGGRDPTSRSTRP